MARFIKAAPAALTAAAILLVSGCASVPVPAGEMATARAAMEEARREGAGQLASAELSEAQDKMTLAERAEAAKEYVTARRAAEQARVMADLAEEKARLAKATQAKSELDNTLKALRGQAATPSSR